MPSAHQAGRDGQDARRRAGTSGGGLLFIHGAVLMQPKSRALAAASARGVQLLISCSSAWQGAYEFMAASFPGRRQGRITHRA